MSSQTFEGSSLPRMTMCVVAPVQSHEESMCVRVSVFRLMLFFFPYRHLSYAGYVPSSTVQHMRTTKKKKKKLFAAKLTSAENTKRGVTSTKKAGEGAPRTASGEHFARTSSLIVSLSLSSHTRESFFFSAFEGYPQ